MDVRIRPATLDDAATICAIYNQGIEDRVATLETDVRTHDERLAWLASRDPHHPVIVAEGDGRVIGWGSLNPFSSRGSYRFVADFSIYVEREYRGRGVGRELLTRLSGLARELDYHKLVLTTLSTNTAGRALYEASGFRTVGVYTQQGKIDGRWVDTVIMEKLL